MATGLLPLYVTIDTARALLTYSLLHSGVKLSPTAISLGSEAFKLAVAVIAVVRIRDASSKHSLLSRILLPVDPTSTWRSITPYLRYAVPAALFLANNVMYLGGLNVVTPALLQTCVLSKLPLTALLHHLVVKPRRTPAMWISLACLSFGLMLAGSPDALWDADQRRTIPLRDLIAGPVIGLTIGIVSACSSIWTELVFKDQVPFWTAQFWLYFWGTVLAAMASFAARDSAPAAVAATTAQRQGLNSTLPYLAVVSIAACSGLSVAFILKQKDNLVKLVGSSLCITTLYIAQHILFPLAEEVESRQIVGIGILTVSTWAYNYHKDSGSPGVSAPLQKGVSSAAYSALDTNDDPSADGGVPARARVAVAASPSAPGILPPTPRRLGICAVIILILSTLPPFLPQSARSIKRDFKAYFGPRHIYPVGWEQLPTAETQRCVTESFGNQVELEQHSSLLADWEERIVHSKCPVYPVPDTGLLFHARWNGGEAALRSRRSRQLATDAFLATQRLKDGHRLVWWYEPDDQTHAGTVDPVTVVDAAFRDRYLRPESPYSRFVEVRILDVKALAHGTCAEALVSRPIDKSAQSDFERTLILGRYGGVWIDAGAVLVRDVTPLIRTGPLIPSEPVAPSADLLSPPLAIYGPAWSGLGMRVLEHACHLLTSNATNPLRELHTACLADPACGIRSFPAQWTTGPPPQEACKKVADPDAARAVSPRLHGIFAWQAQADRRLDNDACWQEGSGSVLSALRTRIDEVLETMPLARGLDLFPGPGYLDHTGRPRQVLRDE
ncbi:hypothetical protein JCM10908_006991 [Rhodotorula pacifica]|uniref:uncharacterized protein n=1 Tax=Rhodotorula pacifica TaxID=1495444 RepID=UPI00317B22EC